MKNAKKKHIAFVVASVLYAGFSNVALADFENIYPVTTEYYESQIGIMPQGTNVYVAEYYANGTDGIRVVSDMSANGSTMGSMSIAGVDNHEGGWSNGGSAILAGVDAEG